MAYHLPFHRVHQRLTDAGLERVKPALAHPAGPASSLLEPVYDAMLASIRASRVIAMNKVDQAGQNGPGKMKQGYLPAQSMASSTRCACPFFDNRRADSVVKTSPTPRQRARCCSPTGYSAYAHYTPKDRPDPRPSAGPTPT